jgi:tetratricopeptide (TPR) repeat protein
MQQSDLPRAEPAYAKAREVWEKLVSDYRGNIEYAVGLSTVDRKLGNVAQKQNNSNAAVERFAKAIRDIDSLPAPQRDDATVQSALFDAHRLRADELTANLGRHVEAIEDWNEARKFAPKNTRLLVEIRRAQTLARAGEHAEAIEAAEAIAKQADQFSKASAAKAFYDRACIYALASGAADGDMKMTPDQRTTKRDEYAEQAMKLLETARSAGFFKSSAKVNPLDSPDLNAIRDRADFRKLKEEVGSK